MVELEEAAVATSPRPDLTKLPAAAARDLTREAPSDGNQEAESVLSSSSALHGSGRHRAPRWGQHGGVVDLAATGVELHGSDGHGDAGRDLRGDADAVSPVDEVAATLASTSGSSSTRRCPWPRLS
ncbi:hypothetical protein E2562_022690 [Oryza meyeriana var. granulata]|uniref:DUF834 domain-containing protein n=1 Tax=Oryza meyeriana var. granulata TaxID=110450 RepID=A0A6G1E2E4_9ORYZ|nr:hypothetical protein E2562_022690 [Oryza meyeriana var. granulata]